LSAVIKVITAVNNQVIVSQQVTKVVNIAKNMSEIVAEVDISAVESCDVLGKIIVNFKFMQT